MRPGTHIIMIIIALPIIVLMTYNSIIKALSGKKSLIIQVSLVLFIALYFAMTYLSSLLPEKLTVLENLLYTAILLFGFIIGTYPYLEGCFKKAYYADGKPNPNINKDCSDIAEYYPNPKKVTMIAYAYRWSLYCFVLAFIIVFVCRKFFNIYMYTEGYFWIYCVLALFSGLFMACMAFLRPLVKCPNCESDLFYISQDGAAFFKIPKDVIKNKIINCICCKASYALDPKIDLGAVDNCHRQPNKCTC
ncbi:MAG: hypothetical protein KBD64_08310 [Gammaproteobacteria bacterium]|nr:hypothetical protein [Gammaproteobacteria bacterium]